VVLVLAVAALVGRLRPLERAARRAQSRAEQAEALQRAVAGLQERAEDLARQLDGTAARAAGVRLRDRA